MVGAMLCSDRRGAEGSLESLVIVVCRQCVEVV